jgi:addiction module HigA family antidote
MTNNPLTRGLPPVHPGALLREDVLPALKESKAEIARLLGVSRQTLYSILNEEQPVTAQMALRLGKLCGNGPTLWIRMQEAWDLAQAEEDLADELAAIPTLEATAA